MMDPVAASGDAGRRVSFDGQVLQKPTLSFTPSGHYEDGSTVITADESENFSVGRRSTGGRSTGSGSYQDDRSEASWEFTLPSGSSASGGGSVLSGSLRQSKTGPNPGQRRKSSKSKRLSELTVDKLQFNKLGHLYGRDDECRLLQEAWQDVRAARLSNVAKGGSGGAQAAGTNTSNQNAAATATCPGSPNARRAAAVQTGSPIAGANKAKVQLTGIKPAIDQDNKKNDPADPSEESVSDGSLRLATPYLNSLQGVAIDKIPAADRRPSMSERLQQISARGEFKEEKAPTAAASPPATPKPSTVRRLITIRGASGTGKSALVDSVRVPVLRDGGFFLQGKFPQQMRLSRQSVEPYAAFAQSCNELCELVVSLDASQNRSVDAAAAWYEDRTAINYRKYFKFTLQEFRDRLTKEMGSDAKILTRVIPSLLQVLRSDDAGAGSAGDGDDDAIGYLEGQHQLKFAFRRFIRTVATFGPVVLAIDDLQWADVASMELLEALITDRENASLMIIASYRDDAVYDNMPHVKSLETIEDHAAQDLSLKFDCVPIGNIDVDQVNKLLVDLLSSNETETMGLAECVHKKTLGNIFFVIHFLTMLQDSELLVFNFGLMKWTWDLNEVQLSTSATENVVMLMKNKMSNLPESIGFILPILACLGSTFSVPLFSLLVDHIAVPGEDEDEEDDAAAIKPAPEQPKPPKATKHLMRCVKEGLIEPAGKEGGVEMFQWVHDKIQEAAFTLLSEEELQVLKLRLGKILFEECQPAELERNLFTVANLLSVDREDPESLPRQKPVEVAKLFLRAGVKTIENSAFEQAANYLMKGVALLPSDHWSANYELSLELYSTAAEADYCGGNFESMREYCNEVIRQKDRPLIDKRRVYNALIDSTGAAVGHPEAIAICRDLLSKLGVKFPKRAVTLHVLGGIVKVKSTLKKTTSHELISTLPTMTDESKQWTMFLLNKFVTFAYLVKSDLLPLAIFKGLKLTMNDGVNMYSPTTFSLVGLSLSAFVNDYAGGVAFADQALELLKQVKGSRKIEARVLFVVHAFTTHWLRPIQMLIKPLLSAYEIGMATGDTESAAWGIYFSLEYSFRSGASLDTLIADCAFYSEQLREVKQLRILAVLLNLWQTSLFLTGENSFDGTFTGDIVKQEKALSEAGDFEAYLFVAIHRVLMYVSFVFGEHKAVYEYIMKTDMHKGGYEKGTVGFAHNRLFLKCHLIRILTLHYVGSAVFPGIAGIYHLYAFNGLSMVSLYRETKDKKYLKLAKSFAAKIKGYALAGVRSPGRFLTTSARFLNPFLTRRVLSFDYFRTRT
jgi:predicted ATPase